MFSNPADVHPSVKKSAGHGVPSGSKDAPKSIFWPVPGARHAAAAAAACHVAMVMLGMYAITARAPPIGQVLGSSGDQQSSTWNAVCAMQSGSSTTF
jgi:hypothetical protein